MGKAFKCDLCGRLSEGEPTKEVDAPLGKGIRMVASLRVEDSPLDLCSDCALSLRGGSNLRKRRYTMTEKIYDDDELIIKRFPCGCMWQGHSLEDGMKMALRLQRNYAS